MMLAGVALAAAAVLVLPVNRKLLENLSATDSGTRFRAVYALARTYDPAKQSEVDAVTRLVQGGLRDEQRIVLEGLFGRRVLGPPVELVGSVRYLFPPGTEPECRPDVFALRDPLRQIPPEMAKEILRRQGWTSLRVDCWAKGGDKAELRRWYERTGAWDRARLELRSPSAAAALRPACLESCLDELTLYVWLGMPLQTVLERRRPKTNEVDWWTALLFRGLEAADGNVGQLAGLANEVSRTADPQKRRFLLDWLVRFPPGNEVAPPVRNALLESVRDRDATVRRYALELVVDRPEMLEVSGAESVLTGALGDPDPDFRVRAAVGLFDLAPLSETARTAILKRMETESDAVVHSVLHDALTRGTP